MFDKHGPVDIVIWIFCTALLSAGWSLMAMRLVGDMLLRRPMTISRCRRLDLHVSLASVAFLLAMIPLFTIRWLVIGYPIRMLHSTMDTLPAAIQALVGLQMLIPPIAFLFYFWRFGTFRKTGTFSKRIQPAAFSVWLLTAMQLGNLIASHPW